MTVYTKTITAGLALLLAGAPLVGTVSANDTGSSDGTVHFQNSDGSLAFADVDDITFGNIDLTSLSDFEPIATNNDSGAVEVEQTAANPGGTYTIKVQQTDDWKNAGSKFVDKGDLPIRYNGGSLSENQTFLSAAAAPGRGISTQAFNHDSGEFSLDLTGAGDLSGGLNKDLTSEVTWTLEITV